MFTCAGCFARVDADRENCGGCGQAVWIDGKLALLGPLDDEHPQTLRGRLRGKDGAVEDVAVKVLDISGLRDWRSHDRFRRQSALLASVSHAGLPQARGDFEVGGRVFHCQTLIAGRALGAILRGARLTVEEGTRLAV